MKSTTARTTTDTSVTLSLAELASLEADRLRAEEAEAARVRDLRRRERIAAEERAREAEAARLRAEAEERARRAREEAEEKARIEARERVQADIARIEAEAKARLAAEDAVRAHELAVLRAKANDGRTRLRVALVAVVAAGVLLGAVGMHRAATREQALEAEIAKAHDEGAAAVKQRDAEARADVARLDAELAAVARRERTERIAALDRRADDLAAWASERGRRDVAASLATVRTRASRDDGDVAAYESALDGAFASLETARSTRHGAANVAVPTGGTTCADPHDPLCGLDGRVR